MERQICDIYVARALAHTATQMIGFGKFLLEKRSFDSFQTVHFLEGQENLQILEILDTSEILEILLD